MAVDQDFEDKDELEAVDEQQTDQTEELVEESTEQEDDIDPRYRGKSVRELAKMHQEAEKLISRHAQEVGEVRKLADELIKSQLKPKVEEEKPKVDFFENPEEAVRLAVESNPEVKQAKQYALLARQAQSRQELLTKHPDALDIANTPEFREWLSASKTRTRLAQEADRNFDVDAADELYSTWKALKGTQVRKMDTAEKETRNKVLKSASVDTGGSGESSKKIFRRADLIQLQLRKPQEFEARRAEIEQAYYEGRVR